MPSFVIAHLKLPDGRIVLQRRTQDAPYAPGMLGEFGGWIEKEETPDVAIHRELKEETSLDIAKLALRLVREFTIPAGKSFPEDRTFYLYEGDVENLDFAVFEGDGAEAFTVEELAERTDLTASPMYTFQPDRVQGI